MHSDGNITRQNVFLIRMVRAVQRYTHVRGCELGTEKVPSTANSWLRWRTPLCGPMVNIFSDSSANEQRSCMVLCDCVIYSFVHLTYCIEVHVKGNDRQRVSLHRIAEASSCEQIKVAQV